MPTAEVVLCIRCHVGGIHGCVRRDGSDGWRSPDPGGDSTGRARLSTPSANHRFQVKSRRQVPYIVMDLFFLCIVTGASVFWDFGSLHFKASRRPSGQLLRQRQTQRKTLRRPCRRLLRQRQAQQVRAEASVVNGVSLIDRACADVIHVASKFSVLPPFTRPRDAQKSADRAHRAFAFGCGDHLVLLASPAKYDVAGH